jgi:hypothetical protein
MADTYQSEIMVPGNVVRVRVDNVLSYGAMCHVLDSSDNVIQKCLMPSREMGTLAVLKGDILDARVVRGHKNMFALVPCGPNKNKEQNVVAADSSLDIALQYVNAAALVIKKAKELID